MKIELSQIRSILREHFEVDAQITGETRLKEDLGFDSLDSFELCYFCEDSFGVRLAEDAILQAKTIGDVIDLIRQAGGEARVNR